MYLVDYNYISRTFEIIRYSRNSRTARKFIHINFIVDEAKVKVFK